MSTRSGTISVNGTELYHEIRGNGPSVMMIVGATGDAGWYDEAAARLADEFTVVTYDRRGNSRSPRPAGWTGTTIDEQADDAAALIDALGIAPAAVFGSSGGAIIALNLVMRHPDAVRGAVVHEPPLIPVLPYAQELMAQLQSGAQEAFAAGGPRAAMEAFARAAAGDETIEAFEPAVRERAFGNGEPFFSTELEAFGSWLPDTDALAKVDHPVCVGAGEANRDPAAFNHYLYETSEWVAGKTGADLIEFVGGHVPYASHPDGFVDQVRPILRKMS